jgi:hypothetical protein
VLVSETKSNGFAAEFARCFLANLPNFTLNRLSHYEANLWCQVVRILIALNMFGSSQATGANAVADGQSALNLATARLRHVAGTAWSTKKYLNIEFLKDQQMTGAITA